MRAKLPGRRFDHRGHAAVCRGTRKLIQRVSGEDDRLVLHDIVVIATINLDNEHLLRAREVHDPRLNWMLASSPISAC
jgi:hypothetical protein